MNNVNAAGAAKPGQVERELEVLDVELGKIYEILAELELRLDKVLLEEEASGKIAAKASPEQPMVALAESIRGLSGCAMGVKVAIRSILDRLEL